MRIKVKDFIFLFLEFIKKKVIFLTSIVLATKKTVDPY